MLRTSPADGGSHRKDSHSLFPLARTKAAAKGRRTVAVFTKSEVLKSNISRKRKSRSHSRSPVVEWGPPRSAGLKKLLKAHQSKRENARRRQRKFAQKLRATLGERSILELSSVKDPTRRDYLQRLEKFYEFVRFHQLEIKQEANLDTALCDFADQLYTSMEKAAQVGKSCRLLWSLCARRRGFPVFGRLSKAGEGWRLRRPDFPCPR